MQGICVGPEAVQVKGIVSDTSAGDTGYISRDWFGTAMDKNYGVAKGNEKIMGDQVTAR
jgi:hypothetical protein